MTAIEGKCGLIKGKVHGHGHNVSNSNRKTKRMFKLNLRDIRLFSYTLGVNVSLRVVNRTARTVDKYGGLDAFLLGYPKRKLTAYGVSLRKMIAKKQQAAAATTAAA
jgi:large subunit ribosomal protein L28